MRAKKIDLSQNKAIAYLRERGWSVLITAAVGKGAPDSFVARGGLTAAVEWKTGKEGLNELQRVWRESWQGIYIVANSGPDAEKQLCLAFGYPKLPKQVEKRLVRLCKE